MSILPFKLQILSPTTIVYGGEAFSVLLPGEAGNFMMMCGHEPMFFALRTGICKVKEKDGEELLFFLTSGIASANNAECVVTVQDIIIGDNLHMRLLSQKINETGRALADSGIDAVERSRLKNSLTFLRSALLYVERS